MYLVIARKKNNQGDWRSEQMFQEESGARWWCAYMTRLGCDVVWKAI